VAEMLDLYHKIGIDRAEGEGYFLSEGQEDGMKGMEQTGSC